MIPFKILCLDGGGIRGAFGAELLATFEEKLGRPLCNYFDLIAGASTGAIIAAALAAGKPAAEIADFFQTHGKDVFHPRLPYRPRGWTKVPFPIVNKVMRGRTGRTLDDFFQAKYCPDRLEHILREAFGTRTFASLDRSRIIVPAVNLSTGCTHVFRTPHLPSPTEDQQFPVVDILLAATAAPTYFPHKVLPDNHAYCDGGLWATNPSILAFAEAMKIQQLCDRPDCDPPYDTSAICILSIGTGQVDYSLSPPGHDAGILYWSQHVANVMIISQVQGCQTPLQYFFDDRYYQINFKLPNDTWTLDGVQHIRDLLRFGRECGEREFDTAKDRFFQEPVTRYVPFQRDPVVRTQHENGRVARQRIPKAEIERITIHDARARTKSDGDALLVCAYEDEEKFDKMKLEGAISIRELRARISSLPKDRAIIFYCG